MLGLLIGNGHRGKRGKQRAGQAAGEMPVCASGVCHGLSRSDNQLSESIDTIATKGPRSRWSGKSWTAFAS